MSSNDLARRLNILLTRNYDAEKGYEQIAEKTEHPELQTFFKNNREERYRFGHEIKEIEKAYGVEPDKGSSIVADAHRAWINARENFASNDDEAIIEEALRGENFAETDYELALDLESLKPDHKRTLTDHLKAIKNSKEQLEKIKASL